MSRPTFYTRTGAVISECGRYRYSLTREWRSDARGRLVVVGLNPSTADAQQDDPTIRRCVGFAQRFGCGALQMVNLWAYRATDPKLMFQQGDDAIGPANDAMLREAFRGAHKVIAAWGAQAQFSVRADQVSAMMGLAFCFGFTQGGAPRHPLYVRADAPLQVYRECPASGGLTQDPDGP